MAVSLVGSAEAVVAEMGCSDADFRDYCAAVKEPTMRELIACIRAQQKHTDDR